MKTVILAAGVSTRLRPLTNNTPKCMLNIANQSILELTINNLLANNMNDLIVVTGFLEDKIKSFIKNKYPNLKVNYIYNKIYNTTNNIYSLWLVKELVKNHSMLLLDSDIIFNKKIIKLLVTSGYANCLAVKSDIELGEEEIKIKINEAGYISEISKEVKINEAIGESIGIEFFTKDTVDDLFTILDRLITCENKVNLWYESAFQELIHNGTEIFPVQVGNFVCTEIDTLEDIEYAKKKVIPFL
jgi:choline kinase